MLKPLLTGALLYLVSRSVDLNSIRNNLAHLNLLLVLVLLAAYWLAQMISAERWRLLANSLGLNGSYLSYMKLYFAAMFFSIGITSFGGDVIRAYGAANHGGASFGRGVVSAVLDRVSGLVMLLAIGSVAVALHPVEWRGIPLWAFYAASWSGLAAAALLVLKSGSMPFADFRQTLSTMHLSRRRLVFIALLSAANAIIVITIVQQLFGDVGGTVEFSEVCALLPVVEFLTMLPITLSGLGVREWSFVEFFRTAGISPDLRLAVALTLSAIVLVRNLAGGLFLATLPNAWRSPK